MLNAFLTMLAIVFLMGCTGETKKNINHNSKIKTATYKEFEAKEINGEFVKGQLTSSYSVGSNQKGEQTFFIGLVGYSNQDTTFFNPDGDGVYEKKEGNVTYYYRNGVDTLTMFIVKKNDSLFHYDADFDTPSQITVLDKNGDPVEEIDPLLNRKKTNLKIEHDNLGNITYLVYKKSYAPDKYEMEIYSESEIIKKKADQEIRILEVSYTYY